jgi:RNA polymerase sigma-70 factor (ECF subfamily)
MPATIPSLSHRPSKFDDYTDQRLIESIQARDEAALAVLHRRYTPFLHEIINNVVRNDADADEVLQQVMTQVWTSAEYFDQAKGSPKGLISTLARRRAIDHLRRRNSHLRVEELLRGQNDEQDVLGTWRKCGVEDNANIGDLKRIFATIFTTLPPRQRAVLQLCFYGGLSQRQIAASEGIPLGTVKTRLELGLRKVRDAILQMTNGEEWLVR